MTLKLVFEGISVVATSWGIVSFSSKFVNFKAGDSIESWSFIKWLAKEV